MTSKTQKEFMSLFAVYFTLICERAQVDKHCYLSSSVKNYAFYCTLKIFFRMRIRILNISSVRLSV